MLYNTLNIRINHVPNAFVASGPISGPGLSAGDFVLVPSCSAVITLLLPIPSVSLFSICLLPCRIVLQSLFRASSPVSTPTSAQNPRRDLGLSFGLGFGLERHTTTGAT